MAHRLNTDHRKECASCRTKHNKHQLEWRANNQEKYRQYRLDRRQALQDTVSLIKLESGCVDCGYNEHPHALDFDHLPEHDKKSTIAKMVSDSLSIQTVLKEIGKCEVVCANCHRIRTANRSGVLPSRQN